MYVPLSGFFIHQVNMSSLSSQVIYHANNNFRGKSPPLLLCSYATVIDRYTWIEKDSCKYVKISIKQQLLLKIYQSKQVISLHSLK